MRNNMLALIASMSLSVPLLGQDTFTPTKIAPFPGSPPTIYVSYTGKLPVDHSGLEGKGAWVVWWKTADDADRIAVDVASFDYNQNHKIGLILSGTLPSAD